MLAATGLAEITSKQLTTISKIKRYKQTLLKTTKFGITLNYPLGLPGAAIGLEADAWLHHRARFATQVLIITLMIMIMIMMMIIIIITLMLMLMVMIIMLVILMIMIIIMIIVIIISNNTNDTTTTTTTTTVINHSDSNSNKGKSPIRARGDPLYTNQQ